jgi:hypothetical protein
MVGWETTAIPHAWRPTCRPRGNARARFLLECLTAISANVLQCAIDVQVDIVLQTQLEGELQCASLDGARTSRAGPRFARNGDLACAVGAHVTRAPALSCKEVLGES